MFGINKKAEQAGGESAGKTAQQHSPAAKPALPESGTTTVRILRSLPVDGVIYYADQLVTFPNAVLAAQPEAAFDSAEGVVAMRVAEGAIVRVHGAVEQADPALADSADEGAIVE